MVELLDSGISTSSLDHELEHKLDTEDMHSSKIFILTFVYITMRSFLMNPLSIKEQLVCVNSQIS